MQKENFSLVVASQTAIGPKSHLNHDSMVTVVPQDAQIMARKGALFVVADGWLYSRNVSNQITVDTIEAAYYQESEQAIPDALVQAMQQASVQVFQRMQAMKLEWEGTSTCTAAVLCGDTLYGAHIGDGRAYLVRQGQIKQLMKTLPYSLSPLFREAWPFAN
jgi:protein phosphatase